MAEKKTTAAKKTTATKKSTAAKKTTATKKPTAAKKSTVQKLDVFDERFAEDTAVAVPKHKQSPGKSKPINKLDDETDEFLNNFNWHNFKRVLI